MAKRRSKKNTVTVDFSGVTERSTLAEGWYNANIVSVSREEGPKAPYLKVEFSVGSSTQYDNLSLSERAIWRLYKLLRVIGYEVSKTEMEIDLDALIGEALNIEIGHEDYEGRSVSRVIDVAPYEDLDGDDEEEEEEEEEEDEDEDDDEEEEAEEDEDEEDEDDEDEDEDELYTEDQINGMSKKELLVVIEDEALEVEKKGRVKDLRQLVIDALREEHLLED